MMTPDRFCFKTTDPKGSYPPKASFGSPPLTAAWAQTVLKQKQSGVIETDYE